MENLPKLVDKGKIFCDCVFLCTKTAGLINFNIILPHAGFSLPRCDWFSEHLMFHYSKGKKTEQELYVWSGRAKVTEGFDKNKERGMHAWAIPWSK